MRRVNGKPAEQIERRDTGERETALVWQRVTPAVESTQGEGGAVWDRGRERQGFAVETTPRAARGREARARRRWRGGAGWASREGGHGLELWA